VTAILWITAIALIVIGIAGTVLPALPGAILVFGGVALAARIDDFARIPVWLLLLFAVLTAMAWAVDYVAAAVGAKRAGASRHAIIGAAIRTVAGIFSAYGAFFSCRWSAPQSASTWHNLRDRIFSRLEVCRHMHAGQRSPQIGFNSLRPIVSLLDHPRTVVAR
jgi:hypothetical protein